MLLSLSMFTLFTFTLPSFLSTKTLSILLSTFFFILIRFQVPPKHGVVMVEACLLGMFIGSTNPLFYELAVEETFPHSEGITVGYITALNNIAALLGRKSSLIPSHIFFSLGRWSISSQIVG